MGFIWMVSFKQCNLTSTSTQLTDGISRSMSNPTSQRHALCWNLRISRVVICIMGILLSSSLLLLPHMGSWKDILKRDKGFSDLKKKSSGLLSCKWNEAMVIDLIVHTNAPVCILVLTLYYSRRVKTHFSISKIWKKLGRAFNKSGLWYIRICQIPKILSHFLVQF